jgi:protoporphyrinogen oxidase
LTSQHPAVSALIIGAGPAGLTAAHELAERTAFRPLVLERSSYMGGISRTVNYKGNRIDIGGHRFFSKSDRVMQWWLRFMPIERGVDASTVITYHQQSRPLSAHVEGPDPAREDGVMLLRPRRSRIYYLRQFFDYPISLSPATLGKLGLMRTIRIGFSYVRSALFPIRPEDNLEQFFINRFGRELYATFFQSYTEKVWGTACRNIGAAWGAQRIKGLSVAKAIAHSVKKLIPQRATVAQKGVETSLIERFLYPKHGPGQMWETVAASLTAMGVPIETGWRVTGIETEGTRAVAVRAVHDDGRVRRDAADLVFSTMPIQDLVRALDPPAPAAIREIADGLVYRDFMTVGLLLDELEIREPGEAGANLVRDNWIYIQEPDVQVGRLQIFNNWSPYMVADPSKVWIGLEYFCNEGDALWTRSDEEMVALGKEELERIGIIRAGKVRDAVVLRVEKTYPAYFGTYDRFDELRAYLDGIENLYLIGRNGMHRYNNQDHSMLTAMTAVDNIVAGRRDKENIWAVNTEEEYHEERK